MTHTYKGFTILECERVKGEHAGRWRIQTYHQSGTPWADDMCPHYVSLKEARESINRGELTVLDRIDA